MKASDSPLILTVLGSGTSQGVPVIGCQCKVCLSPDPKDDRLRNALLISRQDKNVIVDCGPDFRQQLLRAKVDNIEGILLTHTHNDHIAGLDDVRPINFKWKKHITIYGSKSDLIEVEKRYQYIFSANPYPGAPRIVTTAIEKDRNFQIGDLEITPLEVLHGTTKVMAYRIKNAAYITDANYLSSDTKERLQNLDVLFLNALHHKEHHSHFNLKEAIALSLELKAKTTYLTHISHLMGRYNDINSSLPANVHLAYDGLQIIL